MPQINQGQLTTNGVDFTYLEIGEGPLALCLHGFPDTAWGWERLLPALAGAGYRAVAPFMRGYAPSSVALDGRYQSGVLALDANAFHEALTGDDRAVLIGHDWGALATYGAASHEPARWRRVVAASVPPTSVITTAMLDYDNLHHRFWYQFFFCNPISDLVVPLNDLEFVERLWADWSPGYDGTAGVARVKDSLRDQANVSAALQYYRQTLGGIGQDADLADLQGATFQVPPQPTLYLHGTNDGCMPCPAATELEAAFAAPGSKVMLVEDAGHFLQYEQADLVNGAIIDFLTT